jgi:nucleotide-binding universal stress UspA family protein
MQSNSETNLDLSFPPRRILVAIDGSENAERSARVAIDLAKRYGANLIVLSIVPRPSMMVSAPTEYYDYYEGMVQKWIDEVVEESQKAAVSASGRVIRAQPSIPGEIVEVAELEDVDLIVMGRRGLTMLKGGFKRTLAGSVSSAVVSHAHCNVLIVK